MQPRGPGRPRQTTPEEIRDLARAQFAEHGYENTSLTRIARAAGISRTTLFSYFSAKRDLMWEEFDQRATWLQEHLASGPEGPAVDVIADAILVIANYTRDEHTSLALRLRIVEESEELRAHTALRTRELADRIVTFAQQRLDATHATLVGDTTHALMAAAARAVQDWAQEENPKHPLGEHVAARLQPIVNALRPLLSPYVSEERGSH